MDTCIYCLKSKPEDAFEPEHVLSGGFTGSGTNWTLTADVCTSCNNRFSKFEAHWIRQAIEAMARNFSGPASRSSRDRFDRAQPVEIDHLYVVNRNDPLVYEAGFAFPSDHHYRPQIIDTTAGVLALAGNTTDAETFQQAIAKLLGGGAIKINVPLYHESHDDWIYALLEIKDAASGYRLSQWNRVSRPEGTWLRGEPPGHLMSNDWIRHASFTSRIALDHRGRLYIRSANIDTAVAFLNRIRHVQAPPPAPQARGPGDQTMVFGFILNLTHVYRAVLKTGFNLYAYLFGAAAARHPSYQPLREILLNDVVGEEMATKYCRPLDEGSAADFPQAGNQQRHYMMLDMTEEGILRFRLRLYDSFGYLAHFGVPPPELKSVIRSRRIIVDHAGDGFKEVEHWP